MSNSKRAKERRLKRSQLSKYERDMMARQHSGDREAAEKRALWQQRVPVMWWKGWLDAIRRLIKRLFPRGDKQ